MKGNLPLNLPIDGADDFRVAPIPGLESNQGLVGPESEWNDISTCGRFVSVNKLDVLVFSFSKHRQ